MSDKVKSRLMIAGAAFCAALFLFSGAMLAREYLDQKQSAEAFDEVAGLVKEDVELPALELADDPAQEPEELTAFEKYADVYAKNSDLVGWISIPGTRIDYPVMQTKDRRHLPPAFQREVIDMNKTYLRGDMYYADLGRGIGSEQEGYRPVLIIQNDTGNKHSPTVIVAAISSKVDAKAKLPTHYLLKAENGLELPSLVLMEQLRTIDKRRLETYIGHLEEQHIRRLNRALAVSVGLIEETPKNLIMCLCPACANNFYGTGSYYLRRVHPGRVEKDICTYCGQRPGFDYEVVKKKERK